MQGIKCDKSFMYFCSQTLVHLFCLDLLGVREECEGEGEICGAVLDLVPFVQF